MGGTEDCHWGRGPPHATPFPMCHAVLQLLRGHLRVADDYGDSPHALRFDGKDLAAAQLKLTRLCDRCAPFRQAGLRNHAISGLLRAFAVPASQCPLRLAGATIMTAREGDTELRRVWSELLGHQMTDERWRGAGLSTKNGWLGVQLAEDCLDAAAWSGLTTALPVAARVLPRDAAETLLQATRARGMRSAAGGRRASAGSPARPACGGPPRDQVKSASGGSGRSATDSKAGRASCPRPSVPPQCGRNRGECLMAPSQRRR